MVGLGPGTKDKPTVTAVGKDARVLVRGNTVARLVQLGKTKRWVIVARGAAPSDESWPNFEEGVEALKVKYADGVPA